MNSRSVLEKKKRSESSPAPHDVPLEPGIKRAPEESGEVEARGERRKSGTRSVTFPRALHETEGTPEGDEEPLRSKSRGPRGALLHQETSTESLPRARNEIDSRELLSIKLPEEDFASAAAPETPNSHPSTSSQGLDSPSASPTSGPNPIMQKHEARRECSARRALYGESVRGVGCDTTKTHIRCPNRLVLFTEIYNLKSYFDELVGKSNRTKVTFREIQEKMMRVYSTGAMVSVTSGLCGALNVKGLSEEAIREGVGFKDMLLLVYPFVGEKAIDAMLELVRPPPPKEVKYKISDEEEEEFLAMWSIWDNDHSGSLDQIEFHQVVKDLDQEGILLENNDHITLFLQLDEDESGKVTIENFKRWWFRGEENKIPYIWHPDMTREELEQTRIIVEENRQKKLARQASLKARSRKGMGMVRSFLTNSSNNHSKRSMLSGSQGSKRYVLDAVGVGAQMIVRAHSQRSQGSLPKSARET